MNPKADQPLTIRAFRLTNRQLIPIARALGWTEPDPYNNKSIRDFLIDLIDLTYEKYVEKPDLKDRELEEFRAAIRLVAAYAEGLENVPAALKPAVELSRRASS
jgi:hypothetical protein